MGQDPASFPGLGREAEWGPGGDPSPCLLEVSNGDSRVYIRESPSPLLWRLGQRGQLRTPGNSPTWGVEGLESPAPVATSRTTRTGRVGLRLGENGEPRRE